MSDSTCLILKNKANLGILYVTLYYILSLRCNWDKKLISEKLILIIVSHPVVFLKFIKDTNSSQTENIYYIITFKATCFNRIESSSGLLDDKFDADE